VSATDKKSAHSQIFGAITFAAPKEIAKMALPLLALIVAWVVDGAFPNVYPDGIQVQWYPTVTHVLTIAYLVFFCLGCWLAPVRRKLLHLWGLLAVLFFALAAYDWATIKSGNLQIPYFPNPDAILNAFFGDPATMWKHFSGSLSLLFQGVATGFIAGMIYGTLMGYSRFFNYWLEPFIKVIGPVPSTAWMAIAMVLAPSSHVASVCLVALTTWFPLSVNLSSGIQGVPKVYVERAQIMGASHLQILRKVIYPSVLPNIFVGMFMGLCFSLTSLVTAEMLGVQSGLGWLINYAEGWAEYDLIYATIFIFIVVAFVLITILFKIQKHVMKWSKGAIQW
jgi:NitT/TauT family transport system permease protein